MKVKLDENVPVGLVSDLRLHGHEAATVVGQGLGGAADPVVWRKVQAEGRFLITMDLDFSDVRSYPPGSHPGILLLRPHRDGRKAIIALVRNVLRRADLDSMAGCLAVADEHKTRVRRPAARDGEGSSD